MFEYKRKIFIRETDGTGVIYFGSLLQYGLETFEVFLGEMQQNLSTLFSQGYLFPIVHAEADYKAPLCLCDEVLIRLTLSSLSEKSFTIHAQMLKLPTLILAGETKFVHAFLLQGAKRSSPLPPEVVSILKKMGVKYPTDS